MIHDGHAASLGIDLAQASREELLDHIYLQRKLIRRLYRQLVQCNQTTLFTAETAETQGVAALQQSSSQIAAAPSARALPREMDLLVNGQGELDTRSLSSRVEAELQRVDAVLDAHEQEIDVLPSDVVAELRRVRERLALAVRTPYSHNMQHVTRPTSPDPADACDTPQAVFTAAAQTRGLSAATGPRDKATLEDVAMCAQWSTESIASSRCQAPFEHHRSSGLSRSPPVHTPSPVKRPTPFAIRSAARGAEKDVPLFGSCPPNAAAPYPQHSEHVADRAGVVTPPASLVARLQLRMSTPQRTITPQRHHSGGDSRLSPTPMRAESYRRLRAT